MSFYIAVKPAISQFRAKFEVSQAAGESAYEDEKTGVTFTIPKGLKKINELKNERFDLVLESAHTNYEYCAYASHDIYAEMDEADKQGVNRADINNETFTRQEF